MAFLLIFIIYLSFISLGLPDSLLGSTWPSMYSDLGSTITGAGTLAMLISGCTIISSLMADKLIHKFGTAKVTAFSVAMTAIALFGFSTCTSYLMMAAWCIPYGLGAGAVDSALNNYVALHYSSRHMSWLHCMWGVGASVGPWIMSLCLTNGLRWPSGYRTISLLQVILTVILIISIPMWKTESHAESDEEKRNVLSLRKAIALPGAKTILVAFFCYCSLEMATGLWAPSWLVTEKGISATEAAGLGALFYLGITIGRAISGFISNRMGDQNMIRIGEFIIVIGVIILMFSNNLTASKFSLVLVGLGCAPVYPSIIHSTPDRFGKENSQSLVGIQMAAAYMGSTFAPKIFGLISDYIGMFMYPFYLCTFVVLMILMTERGSKHIS